MGGKGGRQRERVRERDIITIDVQLAIFYFDFLD